MISCGLRQRRERLVDEEVREVLSEKIDDKFGALDNKFDSLKDKLHSVTVWALLLYIALAGTLLTVLATSTTTPTPTTSPEVLAEIS